LLGGFESCLSRIPFRAACAAKLDAVVELVRDFGFDRDGVAPLPVIWSNRARFFRVNLGSSSWVGSGWVMRDGCRREATGCCCCCRFCASSLLLRRSCRSWVSAILSPSVNMPCRFGKPVGRCWSVEDAAEQLATKTKATKATKATTGRAVSGGSRDKETISVGALGTILEKVRRLLRFWRPSPLALYSVSTTVIPGPDLLNPRLRPRYPRTPSRKPAPL
jgi:hypothetical protein